MLQQILFYRELGISLDEIKSIIWSKNYDSAAAMQKHLVELRARKEQIELLINNVEKTIASSKGEITMSDKEKFEGFKKSMVDANEEKYGDEIRGKYGNRAIDESNAITMGLTLEQYEEEQKLSAEINETLKLAKEQGNPSSELAQKLCDLHKQWLAHSWKRYSKEAHLGLGQMYVEDPRFKEYYDKIVPGGAEFLRDALQVYCK